jgi:hypothetical protein
MTCEHLRLLEEAMIAHGIPVTYRGQAWTDNCREWVYFDCYIDLAAVRRQIPLAACIEDHVHRGTHNGQERGFYCTECHDGVMGRYEPAPGAVEFRGM